MAEINQPKGWESCTIENLGNVQTGNTPSKSNSEFFGGTFPMFKPRDLDLNEVLTESAETLTDAGRAQARFIPRNSTYVTCIGATIGKTGFVGVDGTCNQQINAISPYEYVIPKWVYYLMISSKMQNEIKTNSSSTTLPILNKSKFMQLNAVLAPLAEQKVIADKLDTLLAQVETTKARLDRISHILKTFRQSVLAAAVSGKLTEEWREVNNQDLNTWTGGILGDFVEKPTYGSSSKSAPSGLVPVLRMGNLQNGKLDWGNLVYTSDYEEISKYMLNAGDVLFNRTNSPELVGKTSIYRGEREAIYAGYLIRVVCKGNLNPEFVNYLLNSPSAKDYCYQVKSDGVSQSNINAQKLKAFPVNVPTIKEQTEIVRRVEELFAFADKIEQKTNVALDRVNKLTQSILAKAFRGELTADWRAANPDLISGDNSAEALLAKIKAEKEALKPTKKIRKKKVIN